MMVDNKITDGGPTPWLNGIMGDDAKKLIESNSHVIRVIAGPGSGKTTCLKRRIQRLIKKDDVDPNTIFVGTFTRTITKELMDALGTRVNVATIHSFASKQLREYPEACQRMQLRFLLQYETDALLYDIEEEIPDIGDIYKRRKALRMLESDMAQLKEYSNAKFNGAVTRWLQRHQAMLIGGVIYLCVEGMRSEDIPSELFDYVMIDEYQDLTAAEQELVRLIWSKNGTLTVMGDDDQSIYGFRFNHPKGITDFNKIWPECEDLTFNDNYRCGEAILHVANLMMAETKSVKKPMRPKNTQPGKLKIVQWNTLDDEIEGLAQYIQFHIKESFLVLVPRRFIGHRLAEAIGVDAKTMFYEEVLEHPIAQEAFATVSLLANQKDFVATRVYLGLHGTKHEHASRRNAESYASLPSNIMGIDLIRHIANDEIKLAKAGKNHIKQRAKKALELIERSLTEKEIVDLLFNELHAKEESDDEKRKRLIKNLNDLRCAANELLSEQTQPNLAEVMTKLRYRITTRAPLLASESEEPRVKIMTLHSAKGLEADNVVILGIADQFMPGIEEDSQSMEEQKRLLYVAITRARDKLIISWPRKIRMSDILKNRGKMGKVTTVDSIRWINTSRSTLLPSGLDAPIRGNQLLSEINLSR